MKKKVKDLTKFEIAFICIGRSCGNCPLRTQYGCANNVLADIEPVLEKEIEIEVLEELEQ